MLKSVVDAGVPVLVFFAMVVVGMELTTDDLRRAARQPRTVLAATVGQAIALPVVGWGLVRCLDLKDAVAQGVLLVAACPGGTMATVYTYLAGANVALSVTLTAVSCLAAVLTTPLALAALQGQTAGSSGFPVPVPVLAGQLFFLLVLPILIGMAVRRRRRDVAARHGRTFIGLSVAALAALLGLVIAQEVEQFADALADIAGAAALLTALAFGAGWVTAWTTGATTTDRFTTGLVFVVRNVGIATAVAVTVLGRVEFAVFATAYFLAQVPLLLAAVLVFRRRRVGGGQRQPGAETP